MVVTSVTSGGSHRPSERSEPPTSRAQGSGNGEKADGLPYGALGFTLVNSLWITPSSSSHDITGSDQRAGDNFVRSSIPANNLGEPKDHHCKYACFQAVNDH